MIRSLEERFKNRLGEKVGEGTEAKVYESKKVSNHVIKLYVCILAQGDLLQKKRNYFKYIKELFIKAGIGDIILETHYFKTKGKLVIGGQKKMEGYKELSMDSIIWEVQKNTLKEIMIITSKLRKKGLELDLYGEKGFKCLHESDVYHLDNILIDSKTGDIKIIDISISDTNPACTDLNLKNYNGIIKKLKS